MHHCVQSFKPNGFSPTMIDKYRTTSCAVQLDQVIREASQHGGGRYAYMDRHRKSGTYLNLLLGRGERRACVHRHHCGPVGVDGDPLKCGLYGSSATIQPLRPAEQVNRS
eukprot:SAG11_NODE_1126_length_5765_cov_9.701553_6_plen_110_part_00